MTRTRVRWGRVAVLGLSLPLALGLGGRALGGLLEPGEQRTRPHIVVEPGMTLWEIAREHVGPEGDPRPYISELRELNDLGTSELLAGETLVLPVVD